jgi:carbon monoxide dehydrogenase subunit G
VPSRRDEELTVKVSGTATLHATPDQVYAALNDPGVLVRTIPGCEQLEALGPQRYRMTVTAGVASIKGSYLGDVELADGVPPSAFTLKASGSGAPGTVSAEVQVRLDATDDGTLLTYAADAVVGGAVGGVGQRVLTGVARRTAGEFFAAVDAVLLDGGPAAAAAAAPEAPADAAVPAAGAAPADAAVGRVFTRPGGPARRAGGPDVRSQLGGVLLGAAIALVGVWLGFRIGRSRG